MTDKQTVKFGDICREVKLTTKDPIADGYERYIGLEHLDSGSLKIKRWGLIAEDKPSFTRVFKKGQILFGKRRPYLKKAAIAEFDGICSGDIIVLEGRGELIKSSLLPFIINSSSFWEFAVKTSSGSLSPRTKFKSLSEFPLKVQSENIQDVYSRILEKTSFILEMKSEFNDIVNEIFELFIRGELFELKKGELFNSNKAKVKKSVLDTQLSHVLSRIVDCEHKTAPYSKEETKYLVVRTNNVKNGQMLLDDIKYTDELSFNEWTKRKKPEYGDIIFTREAPAGESCIVPFDLNICLGQRSVLLIPDRQKVLPEFLSRYLNSRLGRHSIERLIVGTTVERINIADIPKIRFLLPELSQQKKIINVINLLENMIKQSKDSTSSLIEIQDGVIEGI